MFELVHAPMLSCFATIAAELGGDPDDLLVKAGIDIGDMPVDGSSITYRQMSTLLAITAERLERPDFGMRFARFQEQTGVVGPLGRAIAQAPTYAAALDAIARYSYAHSLAVSLCLTRSNLEGGIALCHDVLLDSSPDVRQIIEHLLFIGHATAKRLSGNRVRARRIDIRHQPIAPVQVYRRFFGCEVRFGQRDNAIHFLAADLNFPLLNGCEETFRVALAEIERQFSSRRPPLHAQVRGMIMHYLGTGQADIETVCRVLHLHPRALHRQLAKEATSFREVRDNVRRIALRYFLDKTDLSMTEISERLGFAEQSTLSHCCRRWFGQTPRQLREPQRTGATEPQIVR